MSNWIIFALFIFIGVGMLVLGIGNLAKDGTNPQEKRFDAIVTVIGAVVTAGTVIVTFLL
ncbi:MAG: hypothetical protein LIP23_05975 [Planctomycetes bacterium]|nr:hypothetical protein [Planctomycetota bacterium]